MVSKFSHFCEGILEAAWLAALVFAPVFFNVFSSRIFEPDKIAIVRSLAVVVLAAWLIKLVEQGRQNAAVLQPGENLFKSMWRTPLIAPVMLTFAIYLISTIFSVTPRASLLGSYQRLQGTYTFFSYLVIFAALVANLRQKSQVDRLVTTIILSSLPVALYGILQRYKLDPIPWGGDTSVRVASSLGNSIFVSSYLIMVIPLTISRVVNSFQVIMKEYGRLFINITRASLYIFILILQFITIYFSGSRGPLLGLMAGLYFLTLLFSLIYGKKWLTYTVLAASIVGAIFLTLLNIPNGPLESLRKSPTLGRFGQLLDTQSNTAKVRYYIWVGASDLVAPHEPIEFPDGSKDAFNFLRPLIGYGPESMYVAFNPFYISELGRVERRNASPDRSHNETWDSLVITGILGFSAYLALFLSFFYFGLSWLGLIPGRRQRFLFWGLAGAGGIIGSIFVIAWGGIPYLGVGLPFGVIVGLLIYLAVAAVTGHYETPGTQGDIARSVTLVVLVSAVMAHWIEINFGIAIVSTRLHFWVYLALLLLVGQILPKLGEFGLVEKANKLEEEVQSHPSVIRTGRSKRQKSSGRAATTRAARPWLLPGICSGLFLGLILVTLSYDFLTNSTRSTSIIEIVSNGLAKLPSRGDIPSYGVLGLFFTTWVVGSLIWASELGDGMKYSSWLNTFLTVLGSSFFITFLFMLWHSGSLSALAATTIRTQDDLIAQVGRLSGLLTNFYFFVFLLLLAIAYTINPWGEHSRATVGTGLLLSPFMLIILIVVTFFTNLRVVHADITFKMAEPFTSGSQWPIAAFMYNHAIDLSPNEDYYYLFLGRAYLEQAKQTQSEADQGKLVEQADRDLKNAQFINPLNTDHTANLARLYSWWASRTSDSALKKERGEISSKYYERAVALSRNSATLWGEWALVYLDVLQQPEEAIKHLETALTKDSKYPFVLGLMGEFYSRRGRTQVSFEQKMDDMELASRYFQDAIDNSIGRDASGKIGYQVALGNIYLEMANLDPESLDKNLLLKSISVFEEAVKTNPKSQDIYRIEEQIGRLYYQTQDKTNALIHIENAFNLAPEQERERLNTLLLQVQNSP